MGLKTDCDISFCSCLVVAPCSQNTNFHLICNCHIYSDGRYVALHNHVTCEFSLVGSVSAVLSKKVWRPEDGCYSLVLI